MTREEYQRISNDVYRIVSNHKVVAVMPLRMRLDERQIQSYRNVGYDIVYAYKCIVVIEGKQRGK